MALGDDPQFMGADIGLGLRPCDGGVIEDQLSIHKSVDLSAGLMSR
jgi:hypothetical protein